jgi:hypothetical protein
MRKTRFAVDASPPLNGWRDCGEHTLTVDELVCPVRLYMKGGCKVLVSREDTGHGPKWHLSISRAERYPGWDEIKDARYSLLPHELTFAMLLPPPDEYVNTHPNCFHLHEIPGEEPA